MKQLAPVSIKGVADAPFYRSTGKEIEVFEAAVAQKLPLLLKGPTGSGKSRFLEYMAWKIKRRMITVVCNDETSAIDLVGRYLVKGSDTVWQDGPLTTGVREGALVYIDEIAEARPDTMVAIHSLADHRRELFIERLNETLAAHPDFLLVASFNPGYQKGFKELKPSTRQRFIALDFTYPEEETEIAIIETEAAIERTIAAKLVKFARIVRARPELNLAETVSTRLLVSTAKLIRSGVAPRLASRIGIVLPLTDEADTVNALQDLAALSF